MTEIQPVIQSGFREVEENFQQLVQLSPDAILVHVEGQIVFANPACLEIVDASSFTDLLGKNVFELFHADSAKILRERISALRQTGEPLRSVPLQLNKSLLDVEVSGSLLTWNNANAVQLSLRQIRPETECEIQLRQTEDLFHQLADSMPQIVWMATADGTIDYHNKKWFEQTGCAESELASMQTWEFLHADDVPKVRLNWAKAVFTGEPFQMEYRYKNLKDDGYRWHLGRALPIKNEDGKVIRWFGTCTDIHDQKLTEIALEEAKEQLAKNAVELEKRISERTVELLETVRSAEALNYGIAHDLRAPLRAMVGFSGALLEEFESDLSAQAQEYARRIAAGAKRMDNLIGALLAYGRLNYEELPFAFTDTELIFDSLLIELQPEILKSDARIKLSKPFPKVWANDSVLKKIFAELIENALKFHEPDKSPVIEIWAEEQPTKNLIWIRDNGIGIPPEHHERVFRVLESLHARNKYPGTGIGLAIVRRGVERLGGRLGLKSAPDQGTCFWIELPKALV